MKNRKMAMLGMVFAAALTAMTACGQKNTDSQDTGKENMVNDVTNGTDRQDQTNQDDTLGDDIEDAGEDLKDGAEDAIDGVRDGAEDVVDGVKDGTEDIVDGVEDGTQNTTDDNRNDMNK